jgi:hypothetical protein
MAVSPQKFAAVAVLSDVAESDQWQSHGPRARLGGTRVTRALRTARRH